MKMDQGYIVKQLIMSFTGENCLLASVASRSHMICDTYSPALHLVLGELLSYTTAAVYVFMFLTHGRGLCYLPLCT